MEDKSQLRNGLFFDIISAASFNFRICCYWWITNLYQAPL